MPNDYPGKEHAVSNVAVIKIGQFTKASKPARDSTGLLCGFATACGADYQVFGWASIV